MTGRSENVDGSRVVPDSAASHLTTNSRSPLFVLSIRINNLALRKIGDDVRGLHTNLSKEENPDDWVEVFPTDAELAGTVGEYLTVRRESQQDAVYGISRGVGEMVRIAVSARFTPPEEDRILQGYFRRDHLAGVADFFKEKGGQTLHRHIHPEYDPYDSVFSAANTILEVRLFNFVRRAVKFGYSEVAALSMASNLVNAAVVRAIGVQRRGTSLADAERLLHEGISWSLPGGIGDLEAQYFSSPSRREEPPPQRISAPEMDRSGSLTERILRVVNRVTTEDLGKDSLSLTDTINNTWKVRIIHNVTGYTIQLHYKSGLNSKTKQGKGESAEISADSEKDARDGIVASLYHAFYRTNEKGSMPPFDSRRANDKSDPAEYELALSRVSDLVSRFESSSFIIQ